VPPREAVAPGVRTPLEHVAKQVHGAELPTVDNSDVVLDSQALSRTYACVTARSNLLTRCGPQ
jgi:hypothetical protein